MEEKIIDYYPVEDAENEIAESDKINTRVMETPRVTKKATSPKPSKEKISTANRTSSDEIISPVSFPTSPSSVFQATNVSPSFQAPSYLLTQETGQSVDLSSTTFNTPWYSAVIGELNFGWWIDWSLFNNTHGNPASGNAGMTFQPTTSLNVNSVEYKPNAKLPKLVFPKFRREVTLWQNFWDSFNGAIHANTHLRQIDEFNHLHSLLEGQAARFKG